MVDRPITWPLPIHKHTAKQERIYKHSKFRIHDPMFESLRTRGHLNSLAAVTVNRTDCVTILEMFSRYCVDNIGIYRAYTKDWCGFNVYYMNTAPFFCVCPVLQEQSCAMSQTVNSGGLVLNLVQYMWNLWWTTRNWEQGFFSYHLGTLCHIIPPVLYNHISFIYQLHCITFVIESSLN